MNFYYNPVDTACKSVIGGTYVNNTVKFTLFGDMSSAELIISSDDGFYLCEAMHRVEGGFCREVCFKRSGLYKYYFVADGCKIGRGAFQRGVLAEQPNSFLQVVCPDDFSVPERFKGRVIYQIFPDRFIRKSNNMPSKGKILREDWGGVPEFRPDAHGKIINNDFFGGDIEGIISKLDYLADLGIGIIYLNPVFEAFSNHRYDTGDYLKIDRLLGSEEDFEKLIGEAKKRDIDIIIDGVFNHTGDDSVYFNKYGRYQGLGAYQSKDSKYYSWYNFINPPDEYESWWGIETLPQVNENDESYREFITGEKGVISYWLSKGVAGIRLDVADELPDCFLSEIRAAVKRTGKEKLIVAEIWEDASDKTAYGVRKRYFDGGLTDSVMNYPLKEAIISSVLSGDTHAFTAAVCMLKDHYPKAVLDNLMNILGTHDTERILTALSGVKLSGKKQQSTYKMPLELRKKAKNKLKIAQLLQFTVFGLPCVYYGDEAGMEGYADPFNRVCFPWGSEDGEVTAWVKKLCALRKIPEFKDGELNILYRDRGCIVYERRKNLRAVTVAVNMGTSGYDFKFEGIMYELLSGKKLTNGYYLEAGAVAVLYDSRDFFKP